MPNYHPVPWRDSISRPISPQAMNDTTRPRHQDSGVLESALSLYQIVFSVFTITHYNYTNYTLQLHKSHITITQITHYNYTTLISKKTLVPPQITNYNLIYSKRITRPKNWRKKCFISGQDFFLHFSCRRHET
jgi:hypothetical protein